MLKAMIVGCGRIAGNYNQPKSITTHGGAYQIENDVEIVACVDSNLEKANDFADLYQCGVEQDLDTALKKYRPDIVSICTPDNTHFNLTKTILCSKYKPKVIFLEKPSCSSEVELNELIELSNQMNIQVVVNHSRRFDQHHHKLRYRIGVGEFGKLINTNATYYSGWQHNGVHLIDTLSYLLNDSIELEKITKIWESPYKNDSTIEAQAIFKNQKSKINIMSFNEEKYQIFEMDFRFEKARLRLEDFGSRILLETKYINNIGENVLRLVDNGLSEKTTTSMQQAIGLICQSIIEENYSLLDGNLLSDISDTMKTIWQGQKMAEQI